MLELIRIDYFFADSRRFPWDVLGLGVPRVGLPHSYICEILADFADYAVRDFMRNKPTLRELQRAAKTFEDSVLQDIYSYSDSLYSLPRDSRSGVEQEVLDFLRRRQEFRKHMQARLDSLYRQGLISVPEEALCSYD